MATKQYNTRHTDHFYVALNIL